MSHSGLCHSGLYCDRVYVIRVYVAFGFMAFGLMPFGLMSPSGIYVVRVKFFWDIVVLYTVGVGTPGPG